MSALVPIEHADRTTAATAPAARSLALAPTENGVFPLDADLDRVSSKIGFAERGGLLADQISMCRGSHAGVREASCSVEAFAPDSDAGLRAVILQDCRHFLRILRSECPHLIVGITRLPLM